MNTDNSTTAKFAVLGSTPIRRTKKKVYRIEYDEMSGKVISVYQVQ